MTAEEITLIATESQIQRALVGHLQHRADEDVWWCAIPNGGKRSKAVAGKLKAEGVRAGAPDLIFLVRGALRCLELKREGGRRSAAQKEQQRQIGMAGGTVYTAYGLDEALHILTLWGVFGRRRSGVINRRDTPTPPSDPVQMSFEGETK